MRGPLNAELSQSNARWEGLVKDGLKYVHEESLLEVDGSEALLVLRDDFLISASEPDVGSGTALLAFELLLDLVQ